LKKNNMENKEILPPLKGVNLGVKTVNRFTVEFPEDFGIKLWSVTSSGELPTAKARGHREINSPSF